MLHFQISAQRNRSLWPMFLLCQHRFMHSKAWLITAVLNGFGDPLGKVKSRWTVSALPPVADLAQSLPMRLPVLIKEHSMQPYTSILIYIIYSWIPYSKRHLHAEAKSVTWGHYEFPNYNNGQVSSLASSLYLRWNASQRRTWLRMSSWKSFRAYFPCFQTAYYLPKQIWVMGEAMLISIQCLALRGRQA